MDLDRLERPLRQMRRLLKQFPGNPAPEEVHRLRTRARRIEAVAAAFAPAGGKKTAKLLKQIKPIRKAAGGVRDADVLIEDLLTLGKVPEHGSPDKALLHLIEQVAAARAEAVSHLSKTVKRRREPGRRALRQYERGIASIAAGKKPVPRDAACVFNSGDGTGSAAGRIAGDLASWPRLTARNLHPFRTKIKELRYVLQLFPDADPDFLEALGKVKNEIGDWHDWRQLLAAAREVLDAKKDAELRKRIELIVRQKLKLALAGANQLRREIPRRGG